MIGGAGHVRPGAEAKSVRLSGVDPRAGLVPRPERPIRFRNLLSTRSVPPRGGRVAVVLERSFIVEASVSTARGVKPDSCRMFDAFARKTPTPRLHGGSGWAWPSSINRRTAGGSIRARSEGPAGAAFVVSLPVTVLQPPAPPSGAPLRVATAIRPPGAAGDPRPQRGEPGRGQRSLVDRGRRRALVRRLEDCELTSAGAPPTRPWPRSRPPARLLVTTRHACARGYSHQRVRRVGRAARRPPAVASRYALDDRTRSIARLQTHVANPSSPPNSSPHRQPPGEPSARAGRNPSDFATPFAAPVLSIFDEGPRWNFQQRPLLICTNALLTGFAQ